MKNRLLLLLTACLLFAGYNSFGARTSTLAGGGDAAGTICSGTEAVIFSFNDLQGSTATGGITVVNFTTAGSYVATDITALKVYRNTTNTFAGATQMTGTLTGVGLGAGAHTLTLTSTFAPPISATTYYFITATVAAAPVAGHTINVAAMTHAQNVPFTFAATAPTAGNFGGTAGVGGSQSMQITPAPITGTATVCVGNNTTLADATGSGTWVSATTAVATTTAAGVVRGVSAGTSVISYYTNIGCPSTLTVSVGATPAAISGATGVCTGALITLSDATSGGTWSVTNGSGTATVTAGGVVTGVTAGTVTASYTTIGCTPATYGVTVSTQPTAVTGTATICVGSVSTFASTPGGGTWSSVTTANATVNSGGGVFGVAAGTSVISYLIGTCVATRTATVNALPSAISGASSLCTGTTTSFTNGVAGGAWSVTNGTGTATITAGGVLSGVTAGTVTVSYTTTGCAPATMPVTVNATPTAITGTTTVCIGSVTTLASTPGGGSWTSVTTANATVNSGGGVFGVAAGTSVISYAFGSCSVSTTVTVNTPPGAISGASTLCSGTTTSFTDGVGGGTWSVTNGTGTGTITAGGVLSGVTAGGVTVSYTTTGCTPATKPVTINSTPTAITGTATVCAGSVTTLASTPGGGTWSSVTTSVATVNSGGGVFGVTAGNSVISYAIGTCVVTRTVTVNPLPGVISGANGVCQPVNRVLLYQNFNTGLVDSTGGTWVITTTAGSVPSTWQRVASPGYAGFAGDGSYYMESAPDNSSTNTNSNFRSPAFSTTGMSVVKLSFNHRYQYYSGDVQVLLQYSLNSTTWVTINNYLTAATDAGSASGTWTEGVPDETWNLPAGALNQATVYVRWQYRSVFGYYWEVDNIRVVGTTYNTTTLSNTVAGGTWSSSNTTVASVNSSSGVVSGISVGSTTINYATLCGTPATYTFFVKAPPTAITGTTNVCAGTTTTLSDAIAGGTWSSSNTGVATVNSSTGVVTGVSSGSAYITYSTGCGADATTVVNVNPDPAAISGTSTLCGATTTTFTDATGFGTWSSANSSVASVNSSSGAVSGVSGGSTTISYTVLGCAATYAVTVNAPAAITGTSSVCVGGVSSLADATGGGTWSSSNTGIATVDGSGHVSGISAGTATISYAQAGCAATTAFSVNGNPAAISGASSGVCLIGNYTLLDQNWNSGLTGAVGGLWSITVTSGTGSAPFQITSAPGYNGDVAGNGDNFMESAPDAGGSGSTTSSLFKSPAFSTVGYSAATLSFNHYYDYYGYGDATARVEYSLNGTSGWTVVKDFFADAVTTGSNSTWTSTPNFSIALPAGALGQPTVYLRWNYVSSYGFWWAIDDIKVSSAGPGRVTLTDATAGGSWSSGSTSIATIVSGTGAVTAVSVGSSNIVYTTPCGFISAPILVKADPGSITGTASVCVGANTTLSNTASGGTWTSSDPSTAAIDATTGVVTGVAGGTATITFSNGCGTDMYQTVTVNAAPATITPSSDVAICVGSTGTLNQTSTGGSWTSGATGIATVDATTGIVSGVSAGTATITYSNGCGAPATKAVIVNSSPTTITGSATVCQLATVSLSNAITGGTWNSSDNTIATVDASTGQVGGVAGGTVIISYATDGCNPATLPMTVNSVPAAIGGSIALCISTSTTLTNSVTGGTWSTSASSVATINPATGYVTATATPGTTTISYTTACLPAATAVVTVNTTTAPISGSSTICATSTVTFTDPTPGGTWSSSNTAVATVVAATGAVRGVAGGTTNIIYTGPCGSPAVMAVTVTPVPAAIGANTPICPGTSNTLTNSVSGGTWSSVTPATATVDAVTGRVTGVAAGTVTISYSNGCGTGVAASVVVKAIPAAITGFTSLCPSTSTTLSNAVAGGTWTSGTTTVASINASTGVLTTTATPGSTLITYSNGCAPSATVTVTNSNSTGPISGASNVCAPVVTSILAQDWETPTGGAVPTDVSTPVNGWTCLGPDNSSLYTLSSGTNPAATAQSGTYFLSLNSYSLTAGGNATVVSPVFSTVGVGGVSISFYVYRDGNTLYNGVAYATEGFGIYLNSTPSTSGATQLGFVPRPRNRATSGTYLSATNSTVATAGWYQYTCTLPPAYTSASSVYLMFQGVSQFGDDCYLDNISVTSANSNITLTDVTPGGTWASSNTAAATVSAAGVVTGVATGTTNISYTGPCSATPSIKSVTVNPAPASITGTATVCVGSVTSLFNSVAGGTWSSANTAVATVSSSTGAVTGVGAGTVTISYANGCGNAATKIVTVNAVPGAISGSSSFCPGGTATLTNTVSGGTWSSSNTSIASVNSSTGALAATLTPGTTTITYSNGCAPNATLVVTVSSTTAAISGSTSVCMPYTTTVLSQDFNSGLTGAIGGTWSIASTVGSGTDLWQIATPPGAFSAATGDGTPYMESYPDFNSQNTTFISPSFSTASLSSATLKFNQYLGSYSFNDTKVQIEYSTNGGSSWTSMVSYLGSFTGSATWTAGTPTSTVSFPAGALGQPNVMLRWNYVSSGGYYWLIDNIVLTGVTAAITLTDPTPGGTWSSGSTSVATVGSSTGIVTAVSVGTATITYSGPCGLPVTQSITVNPVPGSISGAGTVCVGSSLSLTNAAGSGTWTSASPSVATVDPATGVVTGLSAGTSIISFSVGCGNPATATVTVKAPPAPIGGATSICPSSTTVLTDAVTGGAWSSSNTAVASINSVSGLLTSTSTPGTTVITYANGCAPNVTSNVDVNSTTAAISGGNTVCAAPMPLNSESWESGVPGTAGTPVDGWNYVQGTGAANNYWVATTSSSTANPSTGGGPTGGGTKVAQFSSNTLSSGKTAALVSPAFSLAGGNGGKVSFYFYRDGTAGVASNNDSLAVYINTSATIGGTWIGSVCRSKSLSSAFTGTVVSAGWYKQTYSIPSSFTGSSYYIVFKGYSAAGNNMFMDSVLIKTNSNLLTLTDPTSGGTWSSSAPSTAVVSSAGLVTGVSAGTATIVYTGACGSPATQDVTVNPVPGSIAGTANMCIGNVTTFTNATNGGSWSSSNGTVATVDAVSGVVTALAAGTATISYSTGCGANPVYPVTVYALPTPGIVSAPAYYCISGGSLTLSDTAASGPAGSTVTSYNWSGPASYVATSASRSITLTPTTTAASGVYSVTVTYSYMGCTSNTATTSPVTVYPHPDAAITSAVTPCMNYSTAIVFTGTPGAIVAYSIDSASTLNDTLSLGGTFTINTPALTSSHYYTLINAHNLGCSTPVNSVAHISPIPMQWGGGTTGAEADWNTSSNWSCGFVPGAIDDVTIPASAHNPVIPSGTATTRNLTLLSGAAVAVSSGGVLNIKGNLNSSGAISGAGNVILNGTSAQTLTGMGSVDNLTLNNSFGAAINGGGRLTINKTLTLTSGILATGDSLVLASSDTVSSARIAQLPSSGASITGKVRVMQYIQAGFRRFRFLSHPFSVAIPLSQVEDYIDITGTGGAANGFTNTASFSPSAFRYDPYSGNSVLNYDPGWKAFTNITPATDDSNKLKRYQGIRLFMRGAKGEGLGYETYIPSATTIGMTGPVNQGDQTVLLAKGDSANQEYNMMGNPYPSPVDLGTALHNALVGGQIVGSAFYVWNPSIGASGNYQAIPINTVSAMPYYLQANSAFQVRADHDSATLSFTESNKSANATNYLFKMPADLVSLYVYDANYHPWDMLYFRFTDAATSANDKHFDATKPSGGEFNFYSLSSDDQKLVIDARPYSDNQVIPLGISGATPQEFIIKAETMMLPEGGKLYLHDKLLKQTVLLQAGTEYRFKVTKDKATQGNNRFELSMKPIETVDSKGLNVTMTPNPATDDVKIVFTSGKKDNVSVRVTDMSGVSIYSEDLGIQQKGIINIPLSKLASGIYMVELKSGDQTVTQRLVKE